jgi:uncharacterized integral membrane protein
MVDMQEPGDSAADGRDETQTTDGRTPARASLPVSQVVGRIVIGLIAVLFVVFALFNLQPVDFNWVFGETQVVQEGGEYVRGGVPLIILMIGSFVLGGIVTAGILWRRRRRRETRRRRQA